LKKLLFLRSIKKKLQLTESYLPPNLPADLRELHDELIDLRHQVFAHTDIDVRAFGAETGELSE